MIITITKNQYNTLFIAVDGVEVAWSSTIRRQRGFYNRKTEGYEFAKDFTPKKVKASPRKVLGYLAATGTAVSDDAEIIIRY